MSDFYIPRKLKDNGCLIEQHEAFPNQILYKFIILLAEPGAGKTALLLNLAKKYDTICYRANVFKNKSIIDTHILIIDGFDEVAKLEQQSAIDSILTKIENINPEITILSSRSSEWDDKRNTQLICDYLELKPEQIKTYYLSPLDFDEQKNFFNYHYPQKNFLDFYEQLIASDLNLLISNPQYLKLFILSYKQTKLLGKKVDLFKNAIKDLASEHNPNIPKSNRCSINDLIIFSEEIFAKILLYNLSGICMSEQEEINGFHFLLNLSNIEPKKLRQILDTGLFKHVDSPNLYEPIHRIVAEYCAANYLVKKIKNPQDKLSLKRCLSFIAPSNFVRTELRGLLGWMACLGNEAIQTEVIKLDPYACIAHGDPSSLLPSSKKNLIIALGKLAQEDPNFRINDWNHNFNVKGFITEDTIPHIKEYLVSKNTEYDLMTLLLSFIKITDTANLFQTELITLLLDFTQFPSIRSSVLERLMSLKENWRYFETFKHLCKSKDNNDLQYASAIIEQLGVDSISRESVLFLLTKLANPLPREESRYTNIDASNFIKKLIHSFNLSDTEYFLDRLTQNIRCKCYQQKEYECQCINGISKIVGHLLDRYFELIDCNYNIKKLALWLKDLRYTETTKICNSLSVTTLSSNPKLKYDILIQIIELGYFNFFYSIAKYHRVHSGLILNYDERLKLLIHAFDTNNTVLWKMLFLPHNDYEYQNNKEEQINYRKTLHTHARQKDSLMKIWAKDIANRKISKKKNETEKIIKKKFRKTKKAKKRKLEILEKNREFLLKNESQILSGQHFGWLRFFAQNYLKNREEIFQYKDLNFIEETLSNGLDIIEPCLPSLDKLALNSVNNEVSEQLFILLYAICYAIFQRTKTLNNVSKNNLSLLTRTPYFQLAGITEIGEKDKVLFNEEVDRILFPSDADKENFIQSYVVPQFAHFHNSSFSLFWLLSKKDWQSIYIKYCLEWLKQYPEMTLHNLNIIFKFLYKNKVEHELKLIIEEQINRYFKTLDNFYGPPTLDSLINKLFWFQAAFCIKDDKNNKIWSYLKQISENILPTHSLVPSFGYFIINFPQLSVENIYKLFDYSIDFLEPTENIDLRLIHFLKNKKYHYVLSNLLEMIRHIGNYYEDCVLIFDKLLADPRFKNFSTHINMYRYDANKKIILQNYKQPELNEIINFLDNDKIASVEVLRALLIEKLNDYQIELIGLETNPVDVFYQGKKRVDENTARNRIIDWLRPRLAPLDIILNIEAYMSQNKRCDFTATLSLNGQSHLLVVEVKGQWHLDLYNAASKQLYERYSIHPNAESQGIYLVLWFGPQEKVANKNHDIKNALELKESILKVMPKKLEGKIDVFVLDVSKFSQ